MRTVPNNAQVIRLIAVIAFNDDTTHIHGRTPRTPTTVRVEAIPPSPLLLLQSFIICIFSSFLRLPI